LVENSSIHSETDKTEYLNKVSRGNPAEKSSNGYPASDSEVRVLRQFIQFSL